MSATMRDILAKMDNPGAQLRARPHWRATRERLERASDRMLTADLARLRADADDAPPAVRLEMVNRYIRRCHVRNAYFERACAEAGIGGGRE